MYSIDQESILSTVGWSIRSESRLQILTLLFDSARDFRELQRELPIHRTTLRRNLVDLNDKGLIKELPANKTYQLSRTGQVFVDAIEEMVGNVQRRYRLGMYIDEFPRSIPIDIQGISAFRITGPEAGEPNAPMFRLSSLLSIASSFSMFTPVFGLATARMVAAQMEETTEIEIIANEEAVTSHNTTQRSTCNLIDGYELGQLLLVTEGPPYGIVLLESNVVLITYDDNGRILSIMESSDTELTAWAEAKFREQRNRSNPYNAVENQ